MIANTFSSETAAVGGLAVLRPEAMETRQSRVQEVELAALPADPAPKLHLPSLAVALIILVLSIGSYYFFSRFLVMTVVVQGRSMTPTLLDGDHLVLNRLVYEVRDPRRGEVVVVKDPGHTDYAVKRIVAGPGDTLTFRSGAVFLNGHRLREPYLAEGTCTFTPDLKDASVKLGADGYFVLGDNRNNSEDSRYYGPVRRKQILGLVNR